MKGVGIAIKELLAIVLFGGFCLFSDMARAEVTCDERVFDVDKIAAYVEQGADKNLLHQFINNMASVNNITDERASDINVMVEEAYAAKDLEAWKVKAKGDCGSI